MALTLADFKKITNEKEEEAKRVREEERKVDKAERAAERAQHIEAISKIIETSVKDEVRRSVKPVQERKRFSAVEETLIRLKMYLKLLMRPGLLMFLLQPLLCGSLILTTLILLFRLLNTMSLCRKLLLQQS